MELVRSPDLHTSTQVRALLPQKLDDRLDDWVDGALDEFSSHHPRPDGRPRTVLECVQEAMDTLRARIASLEAERVKLREALFGLRRTHDSYWPGRQGSSPCWCDFNSATWADHAPRCHRAAEAYSAPSWTAKAEVPG